jgi:hypothetical protein
VTEQINSLENIVLSNITSKTNSTEHISFNLGLKINGKIRELFKQYGKKHIINLITPFG